MISYAQNFEDVVLMRALSDIKQGFYIDCGAAHPVIDNVTFSFYNKGWAGINVEPDPEQFHLLKKHRPRDINLNMGAGSRSGLLEFYRFKDTGYSTFSRVQAESWIGQGHPCSTMKIPVRKLDDVMNSVGDREIHFIKIDVEGFEKDVLSGIDLVRYRPWIFVIEATRPGTNILVDHEWTDLLETQGYERCLFDGINVYYCAHEHPEIAEKLRYPANCLDNFIDKKFQDLRQRTSSLEISVEIFRRAVRFQGYRSSMEANVLKRTRAFPRPDYNRTDRNNFAGRIYFDITRLMQGGVITGVERVVLNLATGLHRIAQNFGLKVEFVGISPQKRLIAYDSASGSPSDDLNIAHLTPRSFPGDFSRGDIWISAELNPDFPSYLPLFNYIKTKGVKVCSFVYDLFPLTNPEWSPSEEIVWFNEWWQSVSSVSDIIIADSVKVAHQVADYCRVFNSNLKIINKLRWIHLGADSLRNSPAEYLATRNKNVVSDFKFPGNGYPTFLTVATLHPRKGLEYLATEFAALWRSGAKINLVITGLAAYGNDSIARMIPRSEHSDAFLSYTGYLSDKILANLYKTVDCVIYPSYDEGFGLPVMEALQEGGAVILRDTEVMREIVTADDPVFWFTEEAGISLQTAVKNFLRQHSRQHNRKYHRRRLLSWNESTQAMLNHVFDS